MDDFGFEDTLRGCRYVCEVCSDAAFVFLKVCENIVGNAVVVESDDFCIGVCDTVDVGVDLNSEDEDAIVTVGSTICCSDGAAVSFAFVGANFCCNVGEAVSASAMNAIALLCNFNFSVDIIAVNLGAVECVVCCDRSAGVVVIVDVIADVIVVGSVFVVGSDAAVNCIIVVAGVAAF